MKLSVALAASVAAVLVLALTLPTQAAFAATINAEITKNAIDKTADAYSPYPINVNVGDTVIWTNTDGTIHTVSSGTASDPTDDFGYDEEGNPTLIFANGKFQHTFTEAGDFPYYCTLHTDMVGKVIVAAGGGMPTETMAEVELDGNTYQVTAKSAETEVLFADIFPNEAVEVEFEGPGEVELTLPKSMIDGINAVSAGDNAIQFETVSSTATSTTIKFTVPEGGEVVEITGATVVPEFGVIAALVFAVSLVAVIGFARFRGSSFGLGRF
ncbi:plastocyanin/azurin family copper-binding protein [Nitrososphaera sp.]|uniref:plastocyanin/azurin family copper-binding protein n=1 Tax=Nitrososphaera sp. TaxID=1971748 RepID=UPI002EDB594D